MIIWPPTGLRLRLQDLHDTVASLKTLPTSASDFTSVALARYLTVRSAGYLEAVRDDCADQYVLKLNTSEQVLRRVRLNLRTGQGVAPSQLEEFVQSFHPGWATELGSLLAKDDQTLKSKLGSMVAARKKIAHGDGEQVTTAKALQWADAAEVIGKWMIERFDPNIPPEAETPMTIRSSATV